MHPFVSPKSHKMQYIDSKENNFLKYSPITKYSSLFEIVQFCAMGKLIFNLFVSELVYLWGF